MGRGPWAAHYYAASLYAQDCGYLTSARNWAAQFPNVRATALFDGAFGYARERSRSVPLPSTQEETGASPKLKATLTAGATYLGED